jgi:hypothetical protein
VTSVIQIVAVVVSVALLCLVIDLVRRRTLTEGHSLIWLLCAGALLVLSLWHRILDATARWLGVYYPPAVLLLVLVFFVFVASLYFSVVVSGQRRQIESLTEQVALLDERVRKLREPGRVGGGVPD